MKTITTWSYLEQYAMEKDEIHAAIEKVLTSGHLILGESVHAFESAFSAYCGTTCGVGCNSGTDALFLALHAAGIGPGDHVITVSNTAVPTVSAIVSAGAEPLFVDIDPETFLMDTEQLEAALTPQTKCILPVHLYGQCVKMEVVTAFAAKHNLAVIEDCAQSHGARRHGRMAGSFGNCSAFSFYPTKVLGGYGDGGMICTSDETLCRRLKRLRVYGMEKQYYALEHGYNSRLDELHAEILLRKLGHLDEYIHRRRVLARQYDELLADTSLILPRTLPGNDHVYYLYVCRHPERTRIIEELEKRGLRLGINYPWPVHLMSGYAQFGGREGDLPETEKAAREVFSLPMYPALTDSEQQRVSEALHEVLRELE